MDCPDCKPMKQKILTVPNPILRKKAKEVNKIDKKVQKVFKDLIDTLIAQKEPKGAGLSAPQIGQSVRIFAIMTKGKPKIFINPVIVKQSKKTLSRVLPKEKLYLEGCLSIPKYYSFVDRSYKITISYLDESGKRQKATYKSTSAAYIQHEYDHLEGILFVDHVLKQGNQLYKLEKDREGKDKLVPVELK